MPIFRELKRRNVIKVAIAYAVVAWLLIEITATVFPILKLPDWSVTLVTALVLIGFPLALLFAWAFELTPEGLKLEKDVDRSRSITPQTGRKLDFIIIGIMAVAITYFLVEKFVWVGEEAPSGIAVFENRKSIAVLPFTDRSAAEENAAFFAAGIHDDLLTQLGKISALKVISRTSVMQYKDTQKSIPQIARELGVATVLEGGVQRAGDRIRINMQLIDAVTDKHLWAETYDRDLSVTSIFDIQSDIAHAVSRALQASLTSDEEQRLASLPTNSLAAYDAYSRGKLLLPDRTTAALKQAEDSFREAIKLDPEYAEAYVGLADTLSLQVDYSGLRIDDYLAEVESIVEKALDLDPLLGEAHIARASWLSYNDSAAARESYARGVRLSPGYAQGHQWYGNMLSNAGQIDKGIAELRIAHELDPGSGIITSNLAEYLHQGGQADEGWRLCNDLVAQRPAYSRGHMCLLNLAWSEGQIVDAIGHNRRTMELAPGNVLLYSIHGAMLNELGLHEEVVAWFAAQPATIKGNADIRAGVGIAFYYQGQHEKALTAAREALETDPRSFLALSLLAALDLNDERNLGALEALSAVFVNLAGAAPEVDAIIAEHAMLLSALMAQAGRTGQAQKIATAVETTLRHIHGFVPIYHAQALILLGRESEAVDALRRAIGNKSMGAARWNVLASPIFETTRGNPEYRDIFAALESHLAQQRELYLASELGH